MTLILILLAVALPLIGLGFKVAGHVLGVALGLTIALLMVIWTLLRDAFKSKPPAINK